MKDFLDRYVAIVEIIFSLAIMVGLFYAIYAKDLITTGTIIGGIFGYMKGRSDGSIPTTGQSRPLDQPKMAQPTEESP